MTNQELRKKLEALANHMIEVADEMWEHESGDSASDDLIAQHSTELEGASEIAKDWAKEIAKIQASE